MQLISYLIHQHLLCCPSGIEYYLDIAALVLWSVHLQVHLPKNHIVF